MAKPDLTKRYIAETFKRLVEKNDYDSVTVRLIIETCEINRKTFYYHFYNRADLATYVFRTELADRLKSTLDASSLISNSKSEEDKYRNLPCYYRGDDPESHVAFFWTLSNYVKDNLSFFRKLFGSSDWQYFSGYLFRVYQPLTEYTVRTMLAERGVTIPDEEIDYLAAYFTNCSVMWVINRHVTRQASYSNATKRNLGKTVLDAMRGAIDGRCALVRTGDDA